MAFLDVVYEANQYQCTLFPKAYKEYEELLKLKTMFLISGYKDDRGQIVVLEMADVFSVAEEQGWEKEVDLAHASKHYIEADAYDEIAEYLEDVALLDADESNEGKRKAQARTDDRVVAARALQRTAYHNYVRFRDLARTLEHQWRTVSRVGGFVSDEAEGEAAAIKRTSSRGKSQGTSRGSSRGETRRKPRK